MHFFHYTSSLLPWVDQTFDVYSCNNAMNTHYTHTPAHTAPTMPQDLTVDNDGAYTLSVTWRAPADNGGRQIVNYRLEIREVGRGGAFVELDRVTGVSQTITNSSQFTISENTTYE